MEIAAHQWRVANETILADLDELPRNMWHLVRYVDLVADPKQTLQQIAAFADLGWDEEVVQVVSQALPVSRMAVSAPTPEKWRKHVPVLATVLPALESLTKQVAQINQDLCIHGADR